MNTYIALLRGINVGGHRVKMEHLRALWADLGFVNVRSFIQSGNIIFDTDQADPVSLASTIEEYLLAKLGYAVPVHLRTSVQLKEALFPNPFAHVEVTPETRLLVVFSAQPLKSEQQLPICSPDGSIKILDIKPGEIFVVYHLVKGRPPDVGAFFKRAFGGSGNALTTRFYHTLLKLAADLTPDLP